MTKAELVEEVSRVSDLTKKHSEVIVDTVFDSIIEALHKDEKIELETFNPDAVFEEGAAAPADERTQYWVKSLVDAADVLRRGRRTHRVDPFQIGAGLEMLAVAFQHDGAQSLVTA